MFPEFQTGWIEERLRELGKPKNGLARAIGQSEARVTGIIKGTRQIKARELPAISHYLELSVDDILRLCCGDAGHRTTAIRAAFSNLAAAASAAAQTDSWSRRQDQETELGADGAARDVTVKPQVSRLRRS